MSLPADWNVAANVGGGAVFEQEAVAADEDLPQPLEDLGVVDDLVLDQALRDVEGHLGAGEERPQNTNCSAGNTSRRYVNMVLKVHRHHKAYQGWGGGMTGLRRFKGEGHSRGA